MERPANICCATLAGLPDLSTTMGALKLSKTSTYWTPPVHPFAKPHGIQAVDACMHSCKCAHFLCVCVHVFVLRFILIIIIVLGITAKLADFTLWRRS